MSLLESKHRSSLSSAEPSGVSGPSLLVFIAEPHGEPCPSLVLSFLALWVR
jgi:hypothetical protein